MDAGNNNNMPMIQVQKAQPSNIPESLRIEGRGIPSRKEKVQLLESSTYESTFIKNWEANPERQTAGPGG